MNEEEILTSELPIFNNSDIENSEESIYVNENENNVSNTVEECKQLKNDCIKRCPSYLVVLLTVLVIVNYIFIYKNYEPMENIIITGGAFIYPFTFLIIALINKYYGTKEAKKSVWISSIMYIVFIVIVMIGLIPKATNSTLVYNSIVQVLFANNYLTLGNITLYYPIMGAFIGTLVAYIISHFTYMLFYNFIHSNVADGVAMGLSTLATIVLDRLIFILCLFIKNLLTGTNTFNDFIKFLTSEFMVAIAFTFVLMFFYVVICSFVKRFSKEKVVE